MPDTSPVRRAIEATDGLLLVQVPPPVSVSVMVVPAHSADGPEIAAGKGLTVIVVVIWQPVFKV